MSWRGACTCELWQRVLTPEGDDSASRTEYGPAGEAAYVSGEVEDAVRDEWMTTSDPSAVEKLRQEQAEAKASE